MTAPCIDTAVLEELDFATACEIRGHSGAPSDDPCGNPATHLITIHGCAVEAGPGSVTVTICKQHLDELMQEWAEFSEKASAMGFGTLALCKMCHKSFVRFSEFVTSVVPL